MRDWEHNYRKKLNATESVRVRVQGAREHKHTFITAVSCPGSTMSLCFNAPVPKPSRPLVAATQSGR